MTDPTLRKSPTISAATILRRSGLAWFLTAATGQLAFILFIIGFYGWSTVSGNFAEWNSKPLIDGHKEGDGTGNIMFGIHVLMAAVMTLSGLLQLIPQIRSRAPKLHRISGRVFLVLACLLAIGGLWLTWVRGTYLSLVSAWAITFNALLILIFAWLTIKFAIRRDIRTHQVWAMRLFMVANGVWFLRIGMMGWIVLLQGPVGMNHTMSGPTDIVLLFGCYLIPLGVYEVYRRALTGSAAFKLVATLLVIAATVFTALGVFGTVAFMWLPYL